MRVCVSQTKACVVWCQHSPWTCQSVESCRFKQMRAWYDGEKQVKSDSFKVARVERENFAELTLRGTITRQSNCNDHWL